MTLLAMSEEKMELLGLSDEAKELQRQQNTEIQKLNIKLAESQKKEKEARVETKLAEYKKEGFDAFPGLLKEYEATALSDDGDIAVKLQLSDHGHEVSVAETATELAERFMKALPRKDGKVDLGEFANKLETPELDRPELKPKDPNEKAKPKTGADLAEEWAAADPTLAKDPLILSLSENGKGK
jgi:HSP90 family molecular chaperone